MSKKQHIKIIFKSLSNTTKPISMMSDSELRDLYKKIVDAKMTIFGLLINTSHKKFLEAAKLADKALIRKLVPTNYNLP